jgi:hypothetical protein
MAESDLGDKGHLEVTIIIDKEHKRSPNPTTGKALYVLGNVPSDYELLQEVRSAGDDQVIPNDDTVIELKDGDIFYTSKRKLNPGK